MEKVHKEEIFGGHYPEHQRHNYYDYDEHPTSPKRVSPWIGKTRWFDERNPEVNGEVELRKNREIFPEKGKIYPKILEMDELKAKNDKKNNAIIMGDEEESSEYWDSSIVYTDAEEDPN